MLPVGHSYGYTVAASGSSRGGAKEMDGAGQNQVIPLNSGNSNDKKKRKRRVVIIGGGLAGMAAAKDLRSSFHVTVIDAKEYFEFTPGVMRAFCEPSQWLSSVFMYHEVFEQQLGIRFIHGEVTEVKCDERLVCTKTVFSKKEDHIPYDFLLVCVGCVYNRVSSTGDYLVFPKGPKSPARLEARFAMDHLDERFMEGRRRKILEEHIELSDMRNQPDNAVVLVVGAGSVGVQSACELKYYFPHLTVVLMDFLPHCLGPHFSDEIVTYCQAYMDKVGILCIYNKKYDPVRSGFWDEVGIRAPRKTYIFSGVDSHNQFMDRESLNSPGQGRASGGWIRVNFHLQAICWTGRPWGDGRVFAAGDCNALTFEENGKIERFAFPKTAYVAEQQAVHAAKNIKASDKLMYLPDGNEILEPKHRVDEPHKNPYLLKTWYPWGAQVYAISLGPQDGIIAYGVRGPHKGGKVFSKGRVAAAQKEMIKYTKVKQHQGRQNVLSRFAWYLVHHWPVNICGSGPLLHCF